PVPNEINPSHLPLPFTLSVSVATSDHFLQMNALLPKAPSKSTLMVFFSPPFLATLCGRQVKIFAIIEVKSQKRGWARIID
ncbi:MAG: hypothetical protein ABH969_11365, partial [Pseudomonadota bacterium]